MVAVVQRDRLATAEREWCANRDRCETKTDAAFAERFAIERIRKELRR